MAASFRKKIFNKVFKILFPEEEFSKAFGIAYTDGKTCFGVVERDSDAFVPLVSLVYSEEDLEELKNTYLKINSEMFKDNVVPIKK
jgi:hypothetical protein